MYRLALLGVSVLDPSENSDVTAKHFADLLYDCAVQSQLVPTSASSTDLPSDSETLPPPWQCIMYSNDAKALWQATDWKGEFNNTSDHERPSETELI